MLVSPMLNTQTDRYKSAAYEVVCHVTHKMTVSLRVAQVSAVGPNDSCALFNRGAVTWIGGISILNGENHVVDWLWIRCLDGLEEIGSQSKGKASTIIGIGTPLTEVTANQRLGRLSPFACPECPGSCGKSTTQDAALSLSCGPRPNGRAWRACRNSRDLRGGGGAATVELRRGSPGIADNAHARDCARSIAN